MSAIPPKQAPESTPYEAPESGGGLVAMYNAASHAGAESFPVLKAFQDYIEAERTQARKRVMQLSVFYAVLMGVVVTGFLTAGIFMLRNMSSMQSKLLDVALATKAAPAPAVVQTSPLVEESMRQMSRATTELQSALGKKLDGVSEVANQVNAKMASQDGELDKLRSELRQMQEQSAKLKDELVAIKADAKKPVHQPFSYTPPPQRPAPVAAVPQTAAPAPAPVAGAAAKAAPAPVPAPAPAGAAVPKQLVSQDPRFPPAVKEPPQTPPGINAPAPPQGMMAAALPIKGKNIGTIPWRVLIPE